MYEERKNIVADKFIKLFGGDKSDLRFFAAPGRINLIGEHIDYCGGFVFPAALTLDNIVAVRKTNDRKLRMAATDLEGISVADLDNIDDAKNIKWGRYLAGVAKEMMKKGYELSGCELLMDGTVPYGSGLSSSASIELVTAIALSALSGTEDFESPEKKIEYALMGQAAEHNYCNVNCGIMDQFASAMGKKDHAILLNCSTLEYKYVPIELGDYVLVLANTKKKHALGDSKYNERRGEVEIGLKEMNRLSGRDLKNLCDYTEEDFRAYGASIENEIIRKRVEHVILENERVKKAVPVLEAGDLVTFGKILCEANNSIRYLYEVTGDELDAMWEEAQKIPGVLGSRMTGAGFGGCVLNIVPSAEVDEFIKTVGKNYEARTGIHPEFYVCSIGDGAREI